MYKDYLRIKEEVAQSYNGLANINRNDYSYQISVLHHWTTKKRVCSGLKWTKYKTKHHSEYRNETRFKDAEYNHDLQIAKQKLDKLTHELVNIQRQVESEMGTKLQQAERDLSIAAREYDSSSSSVVQSGSDLADQQRQKSILLQRKELLNLQKSEIKQEITVVQEAVARKHQATMDYIAGLNENDRAKLLIKCFGRADMEFLVNHIINLGFDMDFAATNSLAQGQFDLFECLLEIGVDCDQIAIGDENLIKYAARCCPEMLEKILQATNDFSCTFAKAINENDLDFINSILLHRPELMAINFMNKVNLLQLAVMKNSLEVTAYLLEHEKFGDYNLADLPMAENGKKIFQFALKEASSGMIELLSSHVNIELEAANLISANNDENNGLIAKLIQLNPLFINSSLVLHALEQNNFKAAKLMINNENLMEVVVIVVDRERIDLLDWLTQERPDLMQNPQIAGLLELNIVDNVVQNKEKIIHPTLLDHSVNEVLVENEMQLFGESEIELYSNLEY